MKNDKKCGYVAIIGITNSGKSTLLNAIVNQKISIVSKKIQTTNKNIITLKEIDNTQMLFIDTPGIHFNSRLQFKMKNINIKQTLESADVSIIIIDINEKRMELLELIVSKVDPNENKVIYVINKMDTIKDKNDFINKIEFLKEKLNINCNMVIISALRRKNIQLLEEKIINLLPLSPFLFSKEDYIIDYFSNDFLYQLLREKVFHFLNKELPYSINFQIIKNEYDINKKIQIIYGNILCLKSSQKPIIIGKNGEKIQKISKSFREELEILSNRKVFAKLFVKVQK